MALVQFDKLENFKAASKTHGREINANITNFTDAQALIQISEIVD